MMPVSSGGHGNLMVLGVTSKNSVLKECGWVLVTFNKSYIDSLGSGEKWLSTLNSNNESFLNSKFTKTGFTS